MSWFERYRALGVQVFPLWGIVNGVCRCRDGASCKRPGKHPKIKWQGADPKEPGPLDNWAVATDTLVVLDFDTVGAFDALSTRLDDSFVVRTGKGVHVWYLADPTRPKGCKVGWQPHVDVRARGGFVVVPPSRTVSGGTYESIGLDEPVRCPEWLLNDLPDFVEYGSRFEYRGTHSVGETNHHFRPLVTSLLTGLTSAQEGGRNQALFRTAARLGELHAAGYVGTDVRDELVQAALGIGLEMDEIERTVNSGWRL